MLESAIWTAATFFPLVEFGGAVTVGAIEIDLPAFETFRDSGIRSIAADIADSPGKWKSSGSSDTVVGRWREEVVLC
jgi:hypothetical protein